MVTLIPESGSEQIFSFNTVFRRLPATTGIADIVPILAALGDGRTVKVVLADGSRGRIRLTASIADQTELNMDLPAIAPLQRFAVSCKVHIALDVIARCNATDEDHAEHLVRAVLNGERSQPKDFELNFEEPQTGEFLFRLRKAMKNGDASLVPIEVLVIGVATNQPRLAHQPVELEH